MGGERGQRAGEACGGWAVPEAQGEAGPCGCQEETGGREGERPERGREDGPRAFIPHPRGRPPQRFLNCRGEGETIDADKVDFWRVSFPELDIDAELAGISVWLNGHYALPKRGGPLPGRLNMENYIANCLNSANRKRSAGAPVKRRKGRSRERPAAQEADNPRMREILDLALNRSRDGRERAG